MNSSVSILLFFLLSGFFTALLVGLLLRNRKLLGTAGACFVAIVCVLVFLHPIKLPPFGGSSNAGRSLVTATTETQSATTL